MATTTLRTPSAHTMHRKVIDLRPDTFRGLSVIAASRGTNLKRFIEACLDEMVQNYDDAAVYRFLSQTQPDGHIMLSPEEQAAFERDLGL